MYLEGPGGRVEALEALLQFSVDGRREGARAPVEWLPFTLAADPLRLSLEPVSRVSGESILRPSVANVGNREVRLGALTPAALVRWSLEGASPDRLRVFQNGWQSWTPSGSRPLAGRAPMSRLRASRRMLWDVAEADPPGFHRSGLFAVLHDPEGEGALLAGFLGSSRAFGEVRVGAELRNREGWPRVEPVLRMDGLPLGPGERRSLDDLYIAAGPDPADLLRRYLGALARSAAARVPKRAVAGWCSWYHYFNRVTEEDLRKNLRLLGPRLPRQGGSPVLWLFQLDDGYQSAVGDWLETNRKFPSGLEPLAREIREAGFTPGLWTAPFLVARNSRLWEEHPDWLLNYPEKPRRAAYNPFWHIRPACALDTTHPEVLEFLRRTYRTLTEWGFAYHKIDFLYAGALHGKRHDPRATRAEALRRGLEAIREGAGPDAFLLGCGCPLGPAIGVVDGMRIGCDVAPAWETPWSRLLGPGAPSTRGALQNILARAPLHRLLWLNDPDCAMLRPRRTRLTPAERWALAAACAAGGGVFLVSDDLSLYGEEEWEGLLYLLRVFRELEEAGAEARCTDLFRREYPEALLRQGGPSAAQTFLLLNPRNTPLPLDPSARGPTEVRTGFETSVSGRTEIPPHGAALVRRLP